MRGQQRLALGTRVISEIVDAEISHYNFDQITLACARAAATLRGGRLITKREALSELLRDGAPARLVADISERRYGGVRRTGLAWRIRRALMFRAYATAQIRSLLADGYAQRSSTA
jgi:hypothetical protein